MIELRTFIHAAVRVHDQVLHELRPWDYPQPPHWRFYLHPRTHEWLIEAARTDREYLRYTSPVFADSMTSRMHPAAETMATGEMRLLGMLVLPDPEVDADDGIELRYSARVHLTGLPWSMPPADDENYTGDRRSHP